jgi:hypothetical protein
MAALFIGFTCLVGAALAVIAIYAIAKHLSIWKRGA